MTLLIDALSWIFLVLGGVLIITGGIGLLRLPDFFSRLHAASIPDTLGALMIVIGLVLQAGFSLISGKLVLIMLLLLFTSPISAHALAKAALHGKLQPKLATEEPGPGEEET